LTFILDNSVTMRWLFNDGQGAERGYAIKVMNELQATTAMVPQIWPFEVANVISRAEARHQLLKADSEAFIGLLGDVRVEVDPDSSLYALSDTFELSRSYSLSAYDASYLELALRTRFPLATLDQKLKMAAKKAGAGIFV